MPEEISTAVAAPADGESTASLQPPAADGSQVNISEDEDHDETTTTTQSKTSITTDSTSSADPSTNNTSNSSINNKERQIEGI